MQTFLDQIIQDLQKEFGDDISEICIVVPTRRAVVFLREALANTYQTTLWAPRMISIQDFIRDVSGWQFPDILPLVFELYQVYTKRLKKEVPDWYEPFERFYAWGEMLVKDFDEVDKYCVNAEQLFTNVRDLKEIEAFFTLDSENEENLQSIRRFWETLRGPNEHPTEVQERFLKIWQTLFDIYSGYKEALAKKYLAYDGMAYRHIQDELRAGKLDFPYRKIVFAGFNALSTAEERIFAHLLEEEEAIVYWDVDAAYFTEETTKAAQHNLVAGREPGKFIREYHKKWKNLESRLIKHDLLSEEKHIHITGVPLQVGQAQYLGNLLQKSDINETNLKQNAIVLADENLLFPVLYALPQSISNLNITMGFPLRHTNIFNLLMAISRLLRNQRSDGAQVSFPYKEVTEILNNPYIKALDAPLSEKIQQTIRKKNMIFIPMKVLNEYELPSLLKHIFSPPTEFNKVMAYFETVFEQLLTDAQEREALLEAEYIFHFYTQFNQLQSVLKEYNASMNPAAFSILFREVMQKVRIPFQGEPLVGVQLMGFLETRVLDFEHIYILASNEGTLPDTSTGNSFIPYNLRKGFGLPTYEEKDAIYAYHFYRLLQRTKEIHLIYNTVVNDSGAKEVSRFIRQIRHFFQGFEHLHVHEQVVSTPAPYSPPFSIKIPSGPETTEILNKRYQVRGEKGKFYFSATAMTTYIGCPLRFYFRYVAGIKEPEKVDEFMQANTFGSVLHNTMEFLYGPYVKQPITPEILAKIKKELPACLERAFREQDLGWGNELVGKNYLLRGVIEKLCRRIIALDELSEPFEVLSLEAADTYLETLPVGEAAYRINGTIDRLDYLPNSSTIRILDYKTGRVKLNKFSKVEDCFEDVKQKEAFQGYLYAWLFDKKQPDKRIQVGYYTARHLNEGIQYLNGGDPIKPEELWEFESLLKQLIEKILTSDFEQTDDEQQCRICPYKGICNRG